VKICTHYRMPDGRELDEIPIDDLAGATPVYATFPGWKEDLSGARSLDALPENARAYIRFVEEQVKCPVVLVSVGVRREDTICSQNPFEVR
jgi:adenylosuccinate synthase